MRAAGRNHQEIADALDYSSVAVCRADLSRAMTQVVQEAGRELLTLETTRTERLLAAAFAIIDSPKADHRDKAMALREATRVLDRRAKLLGLDADSKAGQARMDGHGLEQQRSVLATLGAQIRDLVGEYPGDPAQVDDLSPTA